MESVDPNVILQDTPPIHPVSANDEKGISQYWSSGVTSVTHSMSHLIQKISSNSSPSIGNQVLYLQEETPVEREEDRSGNRHFVHTQSQRQLNSSNDKNDRKLIRGFSLNTFNTITKKQSKNNLKSETEKQRQTLESTNRGKSAQSNRRLATPPQRAPTRPAPKVREWTTSVTPRGNRAFLKLNEGTLKEAEDEKGSSHEDLASGTESSSSLPIPVMETAEGPVLNENLITTSTDTPFGTLTTLKFLENFIYSESILSKSSPSMPFRTMEEIDKGEDKQSICESNTKDS